MAVRREEILERNLIAALRSLPAGRREDPEGPLRPGSLVTRREAVACFEAAVASRCLDLEARRLKNAGKGFYTIGSSGHEANACLGRLLELTDTCFLHYRSGALMLARAWRLSGQTPIFDHLLAVCASSEDPISGGRHKVFGSRSLLVPPQTSTIASHLPKAVGAAVAHDRRKRLGLPSALPDDAIVCTSFGDATINHATALSGFNLAASESLAGRPVPILLVCEDNGIGISVPTSEDYVATQFATRPGIDWFSADGRDLASTYEAAVEAIDHCRTTRRPTFLHLRVVRLLGHAGSDVETEYLSLEEIAANEARDPLIAFAKDLVAGGALTGQDALAIQEHSAARVRAVSAEAASRPRLTTAREVIAPLALPSRKDVDPGLAMAPAAARAEVFGGALPEDQRPRHMAFLLSQGLADLMAAHPEMLVFGEDVGRKGGVYHVTADLQARFGPDRVFDTILDETSILGLAIGAGQMGLLPVPEIQYLAYVHNALDQIRGEAASLKFFSKGQFTNPMVVRIASLGYQKGFGGHFHNDNSIGALRDIPGLVIAVPSRGDDAVSMLRTCAAAAKAAGAVVLFLEPIALYMTKDLLREGDGAWSFPYPTPGVSVPIGEPRLYAPKAPVESRKEAAGLLVVTFGNGTYLSLRAREALAERGVAARVMDLRWISPLPIAAVKREALAAGRCLVVDECRRTGGGVAEAILAALAEDEETRGVRSARVTAEDTFIPLGSAANLVLPSEEDIARAALALVRGEVGVP